jgi:hypothetical protein
MITLIYGRHNPFMVKNHHANETGTLQRILKGIESHHKLSVEAVLERLDL